MKNHITKGYVLATTKSGQIRTNLIIASKYNDILLKGVIIV